MEIEIKITDPILRIYVNGLFEKRDGLPFVNDATLTGIIICSLIKTRDTQYVHPDRQKYPDQFVRFRLSESNYNYHLRDKFLYLSPTDEARINVTLSREFNMNLKVHCADCLTMGIKLKDALDMFMFDNHMDDYFSGDIETLKKRQYRYLIKSMSEIRERLRHRVYNFRRNNVQKFKK